MDKRTHRIRLYAVGPKGGLSFIGTRVVPACDLLPRIGEALILNRSLPDDAKESKLVPHKVVDVIHDWSKVPHVIDVHLEEKK